MAINNLVTTTEAAEIIDVSPIRVRQFHKENRLRGTLVGPILLFQRKDVERFASRIRTSGRPPKSAKKRG